MKVVAKHHIDFFNFTAKTPHVAELRVRKHDLRVPGPSM